MKKLSFSSLTALLILPTFPLTAATILTETFSMSTSVLIPDDDASGVVQIIMPTTAIAVLDNVKLTLTTTGGWNGDLYAYLWHNGSLTVLVNRAGRDMANPDGSATAGFNITLDDAAAMDVHTIPVSGAPITGSFQPDGRNLDPMLALTTSPRTQTLANFIGMPAAGDWRLFIADVATGEQATLASWSITLIGPDAIPEPSSALLLAGSAMLFTRRRRRS